jgi:uncharacterized protein (DUF58 family)
VTTTRAPAARHGALLDAVRGLRWPATRAVPGGLPGAHASRQRGSTAEFTEYRPYRPGDDPRRIDWRLLARSDRAYLRLATDRVVLPTLVVADASASMAFPVETLGKWEHACALAVGLASVAHGQADPVGAAVAHASGERMLMPRTRRGVVGEIGRLLDDSPPAGSTALAPLVTRAHHVAAVRRLVLVSDLLGDADATLRAATSMLASGGEVHVVHVVAREELDPRAEPAEVVDPEDATVRRRLGERSHDAYLARFADWRESIARDWRAAGASYALVSTEEDPARAVRRIVRGATAGAGARR